MAKFRNINHSALERAHFLRIERYARAVDQIYADAVKEFAKLAKTANFDPNKPFSFATYRNTQKTANRLFSEMASSVEATVLRGDKDEWLQAASNNDRLVDAIFGSSRIGRKQLEQYRDRNLEALKAFQNRKSAGMNLSDRVWKQTQQFKSEIEMGIDLGLGEGKSAAALSRDLRSNLQDPEKLFRRVRDKHGILHLSKNAQAYHPGQGVYRSSYKNAMRLTRTEINMAYRESDYHRWGQMDFIIGMEIRLSNNPNHCPMCAQLAGKYPKDFKFTGWHPQCRCSAIPILKSDDDIGDDIIAILNDEPVGLPNEAAGAITSMPAGYVKWMADNNDRILTAKSTPYFIKDNYVGGKVGKGLRFVTTQPVPAASFVPKGLDVYEKELGVTVDKTIFNHLDSGIEFKLEDTHQGAYFNPLKKYVRIPLDERRKQSKWMAESVVYHEYGHALDWEKGLRGKTEVKDLMDKYRKKYSEDGDKLYKEFHSGLWKMGSKASMAGKFDRMNQVGALDDTIMSLNSNFGRGHSKAYFAQKGFSEAEFIAHAFENKFKGNPVFKKLAPDLYEDMIKLIDQLLGIKQS
ncbi:hypothetical protein [Parapedobacter soli]|uniref:hypothetical protein n=1 Tax=Parapedobacter soli TaxID=416955 RepID=UPI0021C6C718|nr:hypothetical protein [Parapedobacter soli]